MTQTDAEAVLTAVAEIRYLRARDELLTAERDALRAVLIEVRAAYQGVGDFEGTGENMVGLIPKIDALLGPGWWDGRLAVRDVS